MTLIGYDPDRVRVLRRVAGRVADDLAGVRSDDPAAAPAMAVVRAVREDLDQRCLGLAERVLASDAMLAFRLAGLVPLAGAIAAQVARGAGGGTSNTDDALGVLLRHFEDLDVDGDGELSGDELALGTVHRDRDVAASCEHLLAKPLTLFNAAISRSPWWESSGSHRVDVAEIALTPLSIATTLTQNRLVRLLADPATFAALDAEKTGEVDGLVSKHDVMIRLGRETDPLVRQSLQVLLDADLHGRIDRDHLLGTSDGTIAYDQVYALGVHQGAFDGLPDPAIPAGLRRLYDGPPEPTGDRTPQFLHQAIAPQPGMGQVVVALYIPTATAGLFDVDWLHSTGNARGPDPRAHPSDSKGWAVVDYETGLITVRVNPSCSASDAGACQDPLPIVTDFGGWANVFQRVPLVVDDSNRVRVVDGARTRIRFGIINSDKRTLAPQLDATFHVATNDDGTVDLEWDRNPFPALEAYHVYPDGRIVPLAADPVTTDPATGLAYGARVGAGHG